MADKLAKDAAKARAAGMSYGMWKAMQAPVKLADGELPPGWLICEHCKKPFKPRTNRNQRFCEVVCQKRAQYLREKERKEKKKNENKSDA